MDETRRAALRALLNPRSAAIVGASSTPGKLGHTIARNMIDRGFRGTLHAINPRESEILGLPVAKDLAALPEPVDLVVVAVPGDRVVPVIEQAVDRGAKGAIVVSAGFAEASPEGTANEARLREIAQRSGIALVGPNCQGVISVRGAVSAWFGPQPDQAGPGFFVSQSGGLAGTIVAWLNRREIGLFDTIVSTGNKCAIDEADLLAVCEDDDHIKFAMCYVEGFTEGRGRTFVEAARRLRQRNKPVIVLKGGRSPAGGRAASSHTGSLAGADRVFAAAMREAGVSLVEHIRDFINLGRLAAAQQPAPGNRVLILTNLGGPGVIAADLCEKADLVVPETPKALQDSLRGRVPRYCSTRNPIDLAGDPAPERYGAILGEVYGADAFDGILIIAAPLAGAVQIAKDIVSAHASAAVPTAVCWMTTDETGIAASKILEVGGLPAYEMPEDAVAVLRAMLRSTAP